MKIPAIFEQAKDEKNWLIFAIGKPNENGKRAKRPVVNDRPYIWTDRDKAAVFTLERARERMKVFKDNTTFGSLEDINRKVAKRRAELISNGKKPGPLIEIERYTIGYFPRRKSILIALDFDNCVHNGVIEDFELAGLIEKTAAYAEISSSCTGLRVIMPRHPRDELLHGGEKNDVGAFVSEKGAACALTFDVLKDGTQRDEALVNFVVERRGAKEQGMSKGTEVEDQVLEYGRIEVKKFREIVSQVKNDSRFDGFDVWLGMVRGAKEYYEVVDPDRLDEVHEIIEGWCETWDGGHDSDTFEEVWDRKPGKGAKAGLGSWFHYARKDGWGKKIEVAPEEVDEFGFLKLLDTENVGPEKKKISRAINNSVNGGRIVKNMPALKGCVGRNVLDGSLLLLIDWETGEELDPPVLWFDGDEDEVIERVQGFKKTGTPLFSHISVETIKRGITMAAKDRPVHMIKREIERLPEWDGVKRIDTWLPDYLGVEDNDLHRAYGRKFLIGMIARGHAEPGTPVKMDNVLCLTGTQGLLKSQLCEVLAGTHRLFNDQVPDPTDDKRFAEAVGGRWVVELSEGDIATNKNQRALKGALTRKEDKYRPAYGRGVGEFPRTCVFIMPMNGKEFLKDPTGSRRFWPVEATGKADIDCLTVERGQLLAEALIYYRKGEQWWLTDEEERLREAGAAEFEVANHMIEIIEPVLARVAKGRVVSVREILDAVYGERVHHPNGAYGQEIKAALEKLGWERNDTKRKRGFHRTELAVPPAAKGVTVTTTLSQEFMEID